MLGYATNALLTNEDMGASIVSDAINLVGRESYAIQTVFTGSPVGSLYISVSINGSDWTVLTDSPYSVVAAGDRFYNVMTAGYLMARLHYARSSGSGTLNAYFSTKEV